uniref:Uncharacterized protein n=1 Tax=Glossina palpalis gambiensis TaxID=67801 RepID=A0A1B0BCX5_9MUSC
MIKLFTLWITCYLVRNVWSDCFLRIPENKGNAPLWQKKVGDLGFKIPYISHRLRLQDGEVINGYCATKFRDIGYNVKVAVYCTHYDRECQRSRIRTETKYLSINERNVTLVCDGSSLKYNSNLLGEDTMSCNDVKWSIIMELNRDEESKKSWCKEDYQTFDLSTNNLDQNRILAKICFDVSLRSIKYKTIERKTKIWNEKKFSPVAVNDLPEAAKVSSEVKFLNTTILHIGNEALQRNFKVLHQKNYWLHLANYAYGSIIQNDPFINYFNQYNQLLDILWWQNLRLTNWRRFLDALQQHTANNSYDVYMGTFDVVQIPLWSNPKESEYLEVQNGIANTTVPQYIWMYLGSTNGKNTDLYVFAYNSPYASFFEPKVKFCSDVCSKINWLESAHFSFGYANCGIIFCCTPDAVKQSAYATKLPNITISRAMDTQADKNIAIPVEAIKNEVKSEEVVAGNKQDFPNKDMLHNAQHVMTNAFEQKPNEFIMKAERPKMTEELRKLNTLESLVYSNRDSDTDFTEGNSGY